MSRQTAWVITGALSIVAIGGGTAVVSVMGQSTDHDLGPASADSWTPPSPSSWSAPSAESWSAPSAPSSA